MSSTTWKLRGIISFVIYAHAEVKKVRFYVWVRRVKLKHVEPVRNYFQAEVNKVRLYVPREALGKPAVKSKL